MVRKGHRPWDETRKSDPDSERQKEMRRKMEREIEREQEQMIRGDVEPQVKR